MLSRWAQQDDIVVGLATNGRRRPELQAVVGDLVNMVALRTQMQAEQTFLQVLPPPVKHPRSLLGRHPLLKGSFCHLVSMVALKIQMHAKQTLLKVLLDPIKHARLGRHTCKVY